MRFESVRLEEVALNGATGLVDGPFGSSLPATAYVEHGVPVIRGSNLSKGEVRFKNEGFVFVSDSTADKLGRSICVAQDIIFTKKGTLGQVGIVPERPYSRYLLSSNQMRLRVDKAKANPDYVYYVLSTQEAIERVIKGSEHTGVPKINLAYIREFRIALPDRQTQDAIVEIIRTLDDRIDLLRQTNVTLASIAQALFKSWFIDFDPVRAKAEGREPEGMGAEAAALFPDSFDDSAVGQIPKGWEATTLSVLCESIFSGGTPDTRKPEYWGGEFPWFSSGETRESVVIDAEKRISQLAVDNSSTRQAKPGDVLIASAGQGLTRGQTSYCDIETYINQSVVSVRTDPKKGHPAWTFYNLSRRYEEMRALSDSHSVRGSLTTKLLAGMRVVRSPVSLMHRFGDVAGPLLAAQAQNRRRVRSFETLRDTLLPRLVSGRLRLTEAEAQLNEALA